MRASNTLVLIMKNRRVSGRKLSEITGISRSAVSQIVNGRLLPTDDELEKICAALDVTPEQIYPLRQMREVLQMTPEEEEKAYEYLGMLKVRGDERLAERDRRARLETLPQAGNDASETPEGEPRTD
jgi:transcriptional regulator with XRE-family HTH domain